MTGASQSGERPAPRFALAAAVAVLIAYGSLYPFAFHAAGSLGDDISHFLAGWHQMPHGRGDILANLLLYVPLGLAATLAFGQGMPRSLAAVLAVVCGASLSLFIELAQFYDAGRVSAFSDFALNAVSVIAGAVLALAARARLAGASWPPGSGPAFARLLLLAWLASRLYPYVPTLEIHKYWRSIQPVLFAHGVNGYDLFRYAALWLSVIFLFQMGVRRSPALLVLAMLGFFAAKASIIGQALSLPELLGAGLALALSPLVLGRLSPAGLPFTAAMLLLLVVLTRVLPWHLAAAAKPFQWIPFFGFLHGSQQIDTISLAEKFYLYGVVILLLVKAGLSLPLAVALECVILFATSYLQTYMVGRSAEISDAMLALVLGLVYGFLRRQELDAARRVAQTGPQTGPQALEISR